MTNAFRICFQPGDFIQLVIADPLSLPYLFYEPLSLSKAALDSSEHLKYIMEPENQ